MKKIVILGAGPTGLGAAYRLYKLGYKNWYIYEKNDFIGGLSASFQDKKGFTWDVGGHVIFSGNDRFNRLVDALLGDEKQTFSRESWIWLRDTFVKYPFQNNFHLHPDKGIVLECASGLLDGCNQNDPYENFEEWIYSFFGKGIAKYFMIPYNRKVWAYPLKKMDCNWISERVSIIDIKRILKNIICQADDSDWGPNNTFRYPLSGGIGGLFNKFLPYTDGHLQLNKEVARILPDRKEVIFGDGERVSYNVLISTIPLNELLKKMRGKPERIGKSGEKLLWNGGCMVGIGIRKACPSKKNWMYFPQDDSPFYRVTYLSNYSPNMTPKGNYFSFLAESSYSKYRKISRDAIIEETIEGLINSKLITEKDRSLIVSAYMIDTPYSFPVPFLGRDKVLEEIQSFLIKNGIFSRGRFGGWKYEVGNMDHSVLQGMEVVERILLGKKEQVYKS
jgi:protoporphyrinogen oxidase